MRHRRLILFIITLPLSLTCVGFLVLELIARILLPLPFSYAQTFTQNVRLFPAGQVVAYNISGLYEGAQTVTLNVTADRFIAPDGTHPVLFLGGSTTESIYVPETQRWVALVGGYNAGVSGSNILDETTVFQYLTSIGRRFDVVVNATMINDFGWYHNLGTLNPDGYVERQNAYFERTDTTPWWAKFSRILQRAYAMQQEASVAQAYINLKSQAEAGRHVVALTDCPDITGLIAPWIIEETTAMQRLSAAVTPTGAKLIMMTETTGYLAPTSSFTVDIRQSFICGSDGMLSGADTALIYERVRQGYLQAAHDAGIQTFDLKSSMAANSDGPNGGRYTYDGAHLTPLGSEQVAQFVRSYLTSIGVKLS